MVPRPSRLRGLFAASRPVSGPSMHRGRPSQYIKSHGSSLLPLGRCRGGTARLAWLRPVTVRPSAGLARGPHSGGLPHRHRLFLRGDADGHGWPRLFGLSRSVVVRAANDKTARVSVREATESRHPVESRGMWRLLLAVTVGCASAPAATTSCISRGATAADTTPATEMPSLVVHAETCPSLDAGS